MRQRGKMKGTGIYLDNSASTRPDARILLRMSEIATEFFANPSSIHSKGLEAERILKSARADLSNCLGVRAGKVIFTSGGTESNNLAVQGYFRANPRKGRIFLTTRIEHPSILEQITVLAEMGVKTEFIRTDSTGRIDLANLEELLSDETALVSVIHVNNETGVIQPAEEIAAVIKHVNPATALHMDAVQAFGKIPVLPLKSGADMVSMSAHKLNGPKGCGALYISERIKLKPILSGGGQEFGLRSGTENVPGIFGFAEAAKSAIYESDERVKLIAAIKRKFMEIIEFEQSNTGLITISPENASPYIISISFPGLKAETIVHSLEKQGIYISTGSACHSRKNIRSHVLSAMSLQENIIDGAVRVSFSHDTQEDEAISAAQAINSTVIELRRIFDKKGTGSV